MELLHVIVINSDGEAILDFKHLTAYKPLHSTTLDEETKKQEQNKWTYQLTK